MTTLQSRARALREALQSVQGNVDRRWLLSDFGKLFETLDAARELLEAIDAETLPTPSGDELKEAIQKARKAHGYRWPENLTSGVMFYEGQRITRNAFEAVANRETLPKSQLRDGDWKERLHDARRRLNEIDFSCSLNATGHTEVCIAIAAIDEALERIESPPQVPPTLSFKACRINDRAYVELFEGKSAIATVWSKKSVHKEDWNNLYEQACAESERLNRLTFTAGDESTNSAKPLGDKTEDELYQMARETCVCDETSLRNCPMYAEEGRGE